MQIIDGVTYYNSKEISEMLGVNKNYFTAAARRWGMRAKRIGVPGGGHQFMWTQEQIDEWQDERKSRKEAGMISASQAYERGGAWDKPIGHPCDNREKSLDPKDI